MHIHTVRVISSVGRAPPLQGGGHWFEPGITHHFYYLNGLLAQSVEQRTFNPFVERSNRSRPTIFFSFTYSTTDKLLSDENASVRQIRLERI